MAIHSFNIPELYLLNNWIQAKSFERSMEAVQIKYDQMLRAALDQVMQRHRELDCRAIRTPEKGKFKVGIGKRTWPSEYRASWPSGFWLGCVGLRHLTSNDSNTPYACVYICPPKTARLDLKEAARRLQEASTNILPRELSQDVKQTVKRDEADIWFPLPEPREKFVAMILGNQSNDFIDLIAAQFEMLAPFIPIMDEIMHAGRTN